MEEVGEGVGERNMGIDPTAEAASIMFGQVLDAVELKFAFEMVSVSNASVKERGVDVDADVVVKEEKVEELADVVDANGGEREAAECSMHIVMPDGGVSRHSPDNGESMRLGDAGPVVIQVIEIMS